MTKIDVVDASDLKVDVFENEYATSGKPLLVRNAAKDWRAMNSFSFEFFRDLQDYAHEYEEESNDKKCQFVNYSKEKEKFQKLQVSIVFQSAKNYYIGTIRKSGIKRNCPI